MHRERGERALLHAISPGKGTGFYLAVFAGAYHMSTGATSPPMQPTLNNTTWSFHKMGDPDIDTKTNTIVVIMGQPPKKVPLVWETSSQVSMLLAPNQDN